MSDSDNNTTVTSPVTPAWTRGSQVELPRCFLVAESGPDAGNRFGPIGEHTTLGREDFCDIGLTDRKVSKQHCEIWWTPTGLRIQDLKSSNGILYEGARAYDIVVGLDARFRVGSTTLRIEHLRAAARRNRDRKDRHRRGDAQAQRAQGQAVRGRELRRRACGAR